MVLIPWYKLMDLHYSCIASESGLLTILAILRYKVDKATLPQTLDELVSAGYLKELPMDPYSNKSLVYKQTDGDFILYSVGRDFTDDSGTPGYDEPGSDKVFWPVKKQD